MSNVHADYSQIIETTKKSFPETYEELMVQYEKEYMMSPWLQKKLAEKRTFGLNKYGKDSFQSNFENAMASPVAIHLEEELIDSFNYALHLKFVYGLKDQKMLTRVDTIIRCLTLALAEQSAISKGVPPQGKD